jgi:putative ABC transport system substrate-binding protein
MKNSLGLLLLIAALGIGSTLRAAEQTRKISRIGVLAMVPAPHYDALLQGLRDLGYIEGENIAIERRYAKGTVDKLPELTAELSSLKLDVVVVLGPAAPLAAKSVKSVPVVIAVSGDPVIAGIVPSLARPGGNITGITFFGNVLAGKRVELLKETTPRISRVAILANPGHAGEHLELKETEAAARASDVVLQYHTVRAPGDFNEAFRVISREGGEAIIAFPDTLIMAQRKEIAEFSAKNRIPSMSGWSEFAEAGGLMTYGPNLFDSFKRVSIYVDKILKGAKPGDLPVEQPTKFELVINLKTAKQIGLTIPPGILARADRVIK